MQLESASQESAASCKRLHPYDLLFSFLTIEYFRISATTVHLSFFLTVSALVYETGTAESVSGSSGMEDGPWHAASCFDGSRLLLRW